MIRLFIVLFVSVAVVDVIVIFVDVAAVSYGQTVFNFLKVLTNYNNYIFNVY